MLPIFSEEIIQDCTQSTWYKVASDKRKIVSVTEVIHSNIENNSHTVSLRVRVQLQPADFLKSFFMSRNKYLIFS